MGSLDLLELADWRRRMSDIYRRVRESDTPEDGWRLWKDARDHLFRTHHQSPLPAPTQERFTGLSYFAYDIAYRATGVVRNLPPKSFEIATSGEGTIGFTRCATVDFELGGESMTLELYWLEGYGGGLFLPFRDATSGTGTYGGGRYLLDTVKGADLGSDGRNLTLDFNFAYNPSCSYDPHWLCPLSPPENHLDARIEAGELYP